MTDVSNLSTDKSSDTKTVLFIGLIAGTLDILAAFLVYSAIMKVATPLQILKGIAGTAISKTLIQNEMLLAFIGLFIHYLIAYCFAAGYFYVYPYIKFLHKNKIVSGLLYGIFVWAIMNLIVLPLANGSMGSFALNAFLRTIIILIICIGLPISILTAKYFKNQVNG